MVETAIYQYNELLGTMGITKFEKQDIRFGLRALGLVHRMVSRHEKGQGSLVLGPVRGLFL